jgi:hypothetical protein
MATVSFDVPKLEVATFDLRLQSRHIAQARISPKDVQKHLKELTDDAENCDSITVYLGEDPPEETEEIAPTEEA